MKRRVRGRAYGGEGVSAKPHTRKENYLYTPLTARPADGGSCTPPNGAATSSAGN